MGICSSCESTTTTTHSSATAKLILQDGRLQEYRYPVKVSYVLQKINPSSFICNSDEMEFDDFVSELDDDEFLQPGQLYFALSLDRLKLPLQAEEMAALAVKASSALMKSGDNKCWCRRKSESPLMFPGDNDVKPSCKASGNGRRGRSGAGGGRTRRKQLDALLSAIPE